MTRRTAEDCDKLIEVIRYPNLFTCGPLSARITERTCLLNQDRWETERHAPLHHCGTCAAGKEIAARHEPVEAKAPAPLPPQTTIREIRIVQGEAEPPWTPHGPRTCYRNGCQEQEYGVSGLCFEHLRRSIGEPYHYAPGVKTNA